MRPGMGEEEVERERWDTEEARGAEGEDRGKEGEEKGGKAMGLINEGRWITQRKSGDSGQRLESDLTVQG